MVRIEENSLQMRDKNKGNMLRIGVLAIVLLVVIFVFILRDILAPAVIGYPAILLLSFLGSATVLLPLPGIASVCTGSFFLEPLFVALLAGTAESAGELVGYAAGVAGRDYVKRSRFYDRIYRWIQGRYVVPLFLFAVIPNPFFDLAGMAAGALKVSIWKFLVIIWPGKFLKSLGIAYACYAGITSVSGFLQ